MDGAGGLQGKRVLVVEDEWLLAEHLRNVVEDAGGTAIGPVATVQAALTLLDGLAEPPDAATLNVRLADDLSYPVADRLAADGVPFAFITANRAEDLPERFRACPAIAKPFRDAEVAALLNRLTR
ncbi:response regulator [Sphingomonas sp. CLY1604]|uniref:response regulator n=1 Tax=Sphingomonas sp. CLY1604 TaxID=3457786 RepID=UPI003FD73AA1